MTRTQRIHDVLTQRLSPITLEIRDDSHRHAGHAGVREMGGNANGETHLHISIISNAFHGLSRVARHQLVMGLLKDEFSRGLHALTLDTRDA